MLGAIYVGLSGMQAFSKGLQTISNNVANLDTLGYKSSTVSFSDVFGDGGNGLAFTAGQAGGSKGNGVRYNLERVDFDQGTLQQTGGALDLAIEGNGFLVVQNEMGDTFYLRTGQFSVDAKGYITNQNGDRLTFLGAASQPEAVNVNNRMTNAPAATKTITLSQNLSSSATTASVPNITVFDASGGTHSWSLSFEKSTAASTTGVEWTVTVKDATGSTIGTGEITFNGGLSVPGSSSMTITPPGAGNMSVVLDFSNVTCFSAGTTSTVQASRTDGHAMGSLTSVTVNDKGQLVLNYSNSQTSILGAVAIADFQDQQQLVRVGGSRFKNDGAGQLEYRSSGDRGLGTLQAGQVEASNVNLTSEFGNLILIQRGFSASSQVISASNDMIQQLFGMKGHG